MRQMGDQEKARENFERHRREMENRWKKNPKEPIRPSPWRIRSRGSGGLKALNDIKYAHARMTLNNRCQRPLVGESLFAGNRRPRRWEELWKEYSRT